MSGGGWGSKKGQNSMKFLFFDSLKNLKFDFETGGLTSGKFRGWEGFWVNMRINLRKIRGGGLDLFSWTTKKNLRY